jgi:predicted nuclease with TOPRIM domain
MEKEKLQKEKSQLIQENEQIKSTLGKSYERFFFLREEAYRLYICCSLFFRSQE